LAATIGGGHGRAGAGNETIDSHDRRIVPKSAHPLDSLDTGICINRQFVNTLLAIWIFAIATKIHLVVLSRRKVDFLCSRSYLENAAALLIFSSLDQIAFS